MKFEKITQEEYNDFVYENNAYVKYEEIVLPEIHLKRNYNNGEQQPKAQLNHVQRANTKLNIAKK